MSTDVVVKRITISLTNRPPVSVDPREWPVIASAKGDSWGTSGDYARYQQALMRGELDRYRLVARQHADGRTLVFAVLDGASAWTGHESTYAGELLAQGDDVAVAMRRVGEDAGLPKSVIADAIADLPVEAL